jgi:dUTP pyrophosphatase
MITVPLTKLDHGRDLPLPQYATSMSAGMDLMAAIDQNIILKPFERALVPTGISLAVPEGYEAQVRPRSGLALNHGLTVLNTPGTIDADYRGEIKVIMINLGHVEFCIERGIRIAQLIISPVVQAQLKEVSEHQDTDHLTRKEGGFGSTGLRHI